MSLTFQRPIGAAADIKELEYISALHQTDHDEENDDNAGWLNASIEATDVQKFLLSRYGINVTKDDVLQYIFSDLGGGDLDLECIDLTEVVAILLIPFLAKIRFVGSNDSSVEVPLEQFKLNQQKSVFFRNSSKVTKTCKKSQEIRDELLYQDESIISFVLKIIISSAIGSSSQSQPLTRDLLRSIFQYYGERHLLEDDDFIDEMIEVASGGAADPVLNAETFANALTYDIRLYDTKSENRFQTHYEDVFGLGSHKKKNDNFPDSEEEVKIDYHDTEAGGNDSKEQKGKCSMKREQTFAHIDFLVDTFRSKTQYIFVWFAVICGYLSWFPATDNFGIQVCAVEDRNHLGCQIRLSILLWLIVMISMILIVAPCVMILSLGNSNENSMKEIIAGICGTLIIVILPHFVDIDLFFIRTKPPAGRSEFVVALLNVTTLFIGSILLVIQASNIVRILIPADKFKNSRVLTFFFRGSSVRCEAKMKQATVLKVHKMVKNAYDLHQPDLTMNGSDMDSTDTETSFEGSSLEEKENISIATRDDALLNYTKKSEESVTYGGFLWAWKEYLSGRLYDNEGIWLHTKLLTGNLAQLILTFVAATVAYFVIHPNLNQVSLDPELTSTSLQNDCIAYFDPSDCIFPETDGFSLGIATCANVKLNDSACTKKFKKIGEFYGLFSNVFETTVTELLPGPASLYYDQFKSLVMPHPEEILAISPTSSTFNYCATPLNFCTTPKVDGYGLKFDACMVGLKYKVPIPFQFQGNLCSDFKEMINLLGDKKQFESNYWPRRWMLLLSLIVGIICILMTGITVAAVTIPSMIISTLKFRSGVIGSLRDPYFKTYRVGILATTYLLGGAIWGSLAASAVIFLVSSSVTFLSVYQVTRPYATKFLSLVIGISMTIILKAIISVSLNRYNFIGYYRKYPMFANISSLCYECWHLALTSGYIATRFLKLLLVMILYIARFDAPLLAKGVGEIGNLKLDSFPSFFKQDLLAMDAHRHPYIERLGMMYLMKLKHGHNFAKKTGSVWRLLFVFALFPWLRQYRIIKDENQLTHMNMKQDDNTVHKLLQAQIAALNQKIQKLKNKAKLEKPTNL